MTAPENKNVMVGLLDQNIGLTGAIYRSDDVTKMPTEATVRPIELDASFTGRGFVDEDGLTKTADFETEEIKEHNGNVVRTLKTSKKETLSFNYLDFYNLDNLKDFYGEGNITATKVGEYDTINIYETWEDLPVKATVIKFKDGEKRITLCIPQAQVSLDDSIEQTFKGGEAIKLPVTFNCLPYTITLPDGSTKEVSAYMLIDEPAPQMVKKVQPKEEK